MEQLKEPIQQEAMVYVNLTLNISEFIQSSNNTLILMLQYIILLNLYNIILFIDYVACAALV